MRWVLVFAAGVALLVVSADRLVGHLVGAARVLRVPLFLLAVVFAGVEFDDIALGVGLNVEDLSGVALGVVFGTAISFTGVVLALAAILAPSRVHVPRDHLVLFAAAPLVMAGFTVAGPLTVADGLLLLGLFVLFLAYVAVREVRRGVPVLRDEEVLDAVAVSAAGSGAPGGGPAGRRAAGQGGDDGPPAAGPRATSGWVHLGLAVLALAGLVVGAASASLGIKGILHVTGLEGTLFGATVVTAVLTLEDLCLTVGPFRRGVPEVGVGNVIGSVVFSVTGKLGITLLAGDIVVGPDVLTWHLPWLVALTGLAACFLSTGRVRRWHGWVLLALYVTYWAVSFALFGGAPVDLD